MLSKVIIYKFDTQSEAKTGDSFVLQVNPSSITIDHRIDYGETRNVSGSIGSGQKFRRIPSRTMKFKTVLDTTGVIDRKHTDLSAIIKSFKKIVYDYDGSIHQPNKVLISWGDIHFISCLGNCTITYKLFSPEGKPLRAELDLTFKEYISEKMEVKLKCNQSPDITHYVEFKAGNYLPELCFKIYNNALLYMEIARINKLTDFRAIKPGTKLIFPPMK